MYPNQKIWAHLKQFPPPKVEHSWASQISRRHQWICISTSTNSNNSQQPAVPKYTTQPTLAHHTIANSPNCHATGPVENGNAAVTIGAPLHSNLQTTTVNEEVQYKWGAEDATDEETLEDMESWPNSLDRDRTQQNGRRGGGKQGGRHGGGQGGSRHGGWYNNKKINQFKIWEN